MNFIYRQGDSISRKRNKINPLIVLLNRGDRKAARIWSTRLKHELFRRWTNGNVTVDLWHCDSGVSLERILVNKR